MERAPGSRSNDNNANWRRANERQPHSLREEVERMLSETPPGLGHNILEKITLMLDAKERAQRLATYFATTDPKDITTYHEFKKLGILLVHHTFAVRNYNLRDLQIQQGDPLLELHLPPRTQPSTTGLLTSDIAESLRLTAEYIRYHDIECRYVTGCTYEPLVSLARKRYGFNSLNVEVPVEWSNRVEMIFARYISPIKKPQIGFFYLTKKDFLTVHSQNNL